MGKNVWSTDKNAPSKHSTRTRQLEDYFLYIQKMHYKCGNPPKTSVRERIKRLANGQYNEFDFFLENEEYRPFDGCKIEI